MASTQVRSRQGCRARVGGPESAIPDTAGRTRLAFEQAVGSAVAGLAALVASGPIHDNGLLTHIATGRLQATGGLPTENPFLVSSGDFPVPSWWWSASLGWVDRISGLGGVRVLTVVTASLLGWLVVRVSRPLRTSAGTARCPEPSDNPLVQPVTALVVLAGLYVWLNARPHLAGFVLLGLCLVVWRERRSPWWLALLFAVWVNVHGSWLHAVAVLGVLWVAEMLDDRSWRPQRLHFFAAVAAGIGLGGLCYPQRMRLVLLPAEQLGDPLARSVIRVYHEWEPPQLSSPLPWIFALLVVLALYGVFRRPAGSTVRVGSLFAVATMAVMGASALRLLPVASIVLAGFAAAGIESATDSPPAPRAIDRALVGLGAVLFAVALIHVSSTPDLDLSRYPVEEVDWLAAHGLVANEDIRLIHNDWVGNYLEFRYGQDAHAWVDDRPSIARMVDYVTLRGLGDGWRDALERADPDVVLWQNKDPLPEELDAMPQWTTALTTDRFRVLCHARIASRC